MESLIFVDSNIWCYYFDRSAKEHNAVSKRMAPFLTANPLRPRGQGAICP